MKNIVVATILCVYMIVVYSMTKNPLQLRSTELGTLLQLVGAASAAAVVAVNCAIPPREPLSECYFSMALAALLTSSFVSRAVTQFVVRDGPFWMDVWDNVALIFSECAVFYLSYVSMLPAHFLRLTIILLSALVVAPIVMVSDIDGDAKIDGTITAALKRCSEAYLYVAGGKKNCSDEAFSRAVLLNTGGRNNICVGGEKIGSTERVVYGVDSGVLYISFAGSALLSDWVTNSRVKSALVSIPGFEGTLVHSGFGSLFNSIIENNDAARIIMGANGLIYRPVFLHDLGVKRIVVCGHSLGGALAVLASYHISRRTKTPVDCVTFGAPQVGDKSFVKRFDSSVSLSVRVVNPYDIVPYSLSTRYDHVRGRVAVVAPLMMNILPASHTIAAYEMALIDDGPISWPALLFLGALVLFYIVYSPYMKTT